MNHDGAIRQLSQALAIGGIGLCLLGTVLAVPHYYKTWKFVREERRDIFNLRYTKEKVFRYEEETPSPPYKIIWGNSERKLTGLTLLFFGGNLAWYFGGRLADEFEVLEKRRWLIRQSEFVLERTGIISGNEVTQTMLELENLGKLSEYSQGFRPESVSYFPSDADDEEETKKDGGYPETANGFFLWLKDKEIRQARVRDIAQKWFNGKHLSSDTIRRFVDELTQAGLSEWLDGEKGEFRMLNT